MIIVISVALQLPVPRLSNYKDKSCDKSRGFA